VNLHSLGTVPRKKQRQDASSPSEAPAETPAATPPAFPGDAPAGTPAEPTTTQEPKGSTGFGATVNCGPYFSSGILICLMVVAICLGILGFGVVVLQNCHTNDRFEDPHGKVLNLGVER
jgi:hypothetical protein